MEEQSGVPGGPVVANDSINRRWSTTFVIIELEIPTVTLHTTTIDSHRSLKRDLECCIREQLVKRAILE